MESKNTTVLVLENHPLMRESLCAAITAEADMKVVETSPEDDNAFQLRLSSRYDVLFLASKPDIILLALGNPGLDDLRVLVDLRMRLHDTPILALVTDEVPGQEQAALRYGARAVLSKSVSREELLGTLRSITTSSQFAMQY